MSVQKPGWKNIPWGGLIVEAGNSVNHKTGGWRSFRPIWDKDKCSQCLRCWILCPDAAILVENGKVTSFDYDFCKGCGICAHECPPKVQAITMVNESEFKE